MEHINDILGGTLNLSFLVSILNAQNHVTTVDLCEQIIVQESP